MILQLNLFGAIIAVSWALALSLDSVFSVIIAMLVFFSQSVPISLLMLLSINIIGFIQASMGGKKVECGRMQRRYTIIFFGLFCALIGSALPNPAWSYPMIFAGLLLSISNSVSSLFFYSHYESLSLRANLQSMAIPAFVAMNILLKVRTGAKGEYLQLWDITLLLLGLSTFLISSMLALSKRRLRGALIYLSQAWIGMLLFLLVIDAGALSELAFAACAIMAVTTIVFLDAASTLGGRYFSFAKIVALGLPGTAGFAAIYFALKITIGFNVVWLFVLGFGYAIQAGTLLGAKPSPVVPTRKMIIRFWLLTLVQFAAGIFLFWLDNRGGLK